MNGADEAFRKREIGRFALVLAIAASLLAVLPFLIGLSATSEGGLYVGHQYNVDDHMVYAAWMAQAAEGQVLFENRFTTAEQPGLTVHLYYLVLGWVSAAVGAAWASTLAKGLFTFLVVWMLGRLLFRLGFDIFPAKLALAFTTFGGGLGWLAWSQFGVAMTESQVSVLRPVTFGRLPIDVWQPEAFVFPSALTNGLFTMSLCLMLGTFWAVLAARETWKPVLPGAVAFGLLMNVHSYDAVLITLVLIGFLAACLSSGQATVPWALRTATIGAGALPAALWFLYVLSQDEVFQARAATETFNANFAQVLFGILPAMVFAGLALWKSDLPDLKKRIGLGGLVVLPFTLWVLAQNHDPSGYFLGFAGWIGLFGITLVLVGIVARPEPWWNLLWAWAWIGLIAPYFPGLFQRKLGMALMVPWAILAAVGVWAALQGMERSRRNLMIALALLPMCATSVFWLQRELLLNRDNVSNTTVHAVRYPAEVADMVERIRAEVRGGREVRIVAPPGIQQPTTEDFSSFATPFLPDLNPIFTGLAGATTVAGHWSETPDYAARREEIGRVFYSGDPTIGRAILDKYGVDYLIAPLPEAFEGLDVIDGRAYGEAITVGEVYALVDVSSE